MDFSWAGMTSFFSFGCSTSTPGATPSDTPVCEGGKTRDGLAPEAITPEMKADRMNATKDLAKMFSVVDKHARPDHDSNEVTPEEMNRIATLYSDIRLGKTDIQFDEKNGAIFRDMAMGDIAKILQTESGRELLTEVAYEPNPNTCKDFKTILGLSPPRDAGTGAGDVGHAGDGKGTYSQLKYMPGQGYSMDGVKYTGDSILYHELVHALHNKRGDRATGTVPAGTENSPFDKGENQSEYQAVGLDDHAGPLSENFYRWERRRLMEDLPDRASYNTR